MLERLVEVLSTLSGEKIYALATAPTEVTTPTQPADPLPLPAIRNGRAAKSFASATGSIEAGGAPETAKFCMSGEYWKAIRRFPKAAPQFPIGLLPSRWPTPGVTPL